MMMRLLAAACLVAVALSLPERNLSDVEYEGMWQGYVADFKKVYHPAEVMTRFEIFKDNVDFINHHNKNLADKLGYTVGLNEFADMTNAEFVRKMNGFNARAMPKKDLNVELFDTSNLADSVDWTTKNAVTPVKNQGQCGSCWAFSTTGSTEGAYAIASGKLVSLSEQMLVSCDHNGDQGCNGGLMDNAFGWIQQNGGICKESDYPYQGTTGTCTTGCSPAVTVSGHHDVPQKDEKALAVAAAIGPVSVAIEADKQAFQFYKSGVFDNAGCGTNLDHGVLVVGYGSMDSKDYWKVKNSWGATWGLNGYILMARGKNMCGISQSASYPTGATAATPGPSPGPPPGPSPGPAPGPSPGPT